MKTTVFNAHLLRHNCSHNAWEQPQRYLRWTQSQILRISGAWWLTHSLYRSGSSTGHHEKISHENKPVEPNVLLNGTQLPVITPWDSKQTNQKREKTALDAITYKAWFCCRHTTKGCANCCAVVQWKTSPSFANVQDEKEDFITQPLAKFQEYKCWKSLIGTIPFPVSATFPGWHSGCWGSSGLQDDMFGACGRIVHATHSFMDGLEIWQHVNCKQAMSHSYSKCNMYSSNNCQFSLK